MSTNEKKPIIKSITIENFKGFGAPVTIPLKPITLLFGANSAGKSTTLTSLAYFNDALNLWRHPKHINISGHSVELGDFRSVVHKHDVSRPIRISVDFQKSGCAPYDGGGVWQPNLWASTLESMFPGFIAEGFRAQIFVCQESYEVSLKLFLDEDWVVQVDRCGVDLNCDSDFVRNFILKKNSSNGGSKDMDHPLSGERLTFLFSYGGVSGIDFSKPWAYYDGLRDWWEGREEEAKSAYEFCAILIDEINRTLKSSRYIGPLRKIPGRHQNFEDISESDWHSGLAAWRELKLIASLGYPYIAHSNDDSMCLGERALIEIRRLDLGYEPVTMAVHSIEQISNKIQNYRENKDLGFGGSLKIRNENQKNRHVELAFKGPVEVKVMDQDQGQEKSQAQVLKDEIIKLCRDDEVSPIRSDKLILLSQHDEVPVYPCDVGTGVSQALPIAVGAFAAGCAVMMVEQPELHLHPRLQCNLADVFVANIRHQYDPRLDKTFLIETHSEHLILRLLRRIRETSEEKQKDASLILTPDDVGVLYVEEADNGVQINELRIGEDGEFIDEWPGGFFEEDFDEIVGGL